MRFRFCQFIEAEPSANEFCKCDREAKPGSSYCPEHHVRCHTAAEAAAEAVEAHEKVYVAPIEISGAQDDQLSASISGGRSGVDPSLRLSISAKVSPRHDPPRSTP